MIVLRMPSFGADMEDAVFVQWHVQPGQAVARGEVVCVVETQKGAIDVEAWQAGTMARPVAERGQRIPVGGVLAVLAEPGEDWPAVAAMPLPGPVAAAATGALPEAGAPGPASGESGASDAAARAPAPVAAGARAPAGASPVMRVSPAARRRAQELGVGLDALAAAAGAAPVTLADVERAAAHPRAPGMRAAVAAAMTRSKREIPHYYVGCEANVEPALRWLEAWNAQRPLPERVLFAALALRAVALALRQAPQLNGRFVDGRFEPSETVHLGVVTSLREGGVVVPTLHDADRMSLPELMAALRDALSRARAGRLRSSDLDGATVTVTQLGDLGTDTVYGVIYPPQVALVGLGRVALRPVVDNGAIVAARTVHLTLSADHRVSDGLEGARFLDRLSERLARPEE
jgi:pyruvate dehydrogenase E2 component (dihydrolipoamide acetyltransferase)